MGHNLSFGSVSFGSVSFQSPAGYADAVIQALGLPAGQARSRPIPVLEPASSTLAELAMLADLPTTAAVTDWYAAARANQPAANGVVLGFGDPSWALPAMLHAHLTGRSFAWYDSPKALVAALPASTGPVSICAPPDQLASRVQADIVEAISFNVSAEQLSGVSFPGRPLSFLTARTLPILTTVVAHHHRHRNDLVNSSIGLFAEPMLGVGADSSITCVAGEDLTVAAIRALPSPDLLMMWGHSREDLFHLGQDGLCGRSASYQQAERTGFVPTCVSTGSCVKAGELLPIGELAAGAIVIGGCNVLRLGNTGLFGPEFSLAFSAQEGGTSAVVTATGVVIGASAEYLFLYRLLRGGRPLGEAVRLLNCALPFIGPDSPSYQVLGEGERVLFEPPPITGSQHRFEDACQVRVRYTGIGAEYLSIRVDRFGTGLQARFAEGSAQPPLHCATVAEPDGSATVFLFGPARLDGLDFEVIVSDRPAGAEAIGAVQAAMANLHGYGKLLRRYRTKLKNLEPEWRSSATYLVRQADRARFDLLACQDADHRAATTEQSINAMDRELCEHYLQRTASARGFTFHEQCLFEDGSFTVTGHRAAEPCPYCGDEVSARTVQSSLAGEIRRLVGICRTCGTIWDRPEQVPAVQLALDPVLPSGQPVEVGVQLSNPLSRPVRGWVGLTVRRARQFGYHIEPALHAVELAGGQRRRVTFSLATTPAVPSDAEFLRAYWCSELALSVAQRTIWTASEQAPMLRPIADLKHFAENSWD
ncbi:MAG: hypothetical protein ABI140_02440 [Jatrophihabitantaceae bacterium]